MENENTQMMMEDAIKAMQNAFALLSSPNIRSRENSLVLTKLEEAMMWCNKDRTIKGFLSTNPTHTTNSAK
jgi:hypothetical protein